MSTTTSTALADVEKRTVAVTSTNGEPVTYDGNPAALAGVRHEIDKCFERLGAYELLIKHGACKLQNSCKETEYCVSQCCQLYK